ncbi:hypothetical protein ACVBEH_16275 [Roseateles sp. GG27B]
MFRDDDAAAEDEELAIGGLLEYSMLAEVGDAVLLTLDDAQPTADLPRWWPASGAHPPGRPLPVAELGFRAERLLVDNLVPMLEQWCELQSLFPLTAAKHRCGLRSRVCNWTTGWTACDHAAGRAIGLAGAESEPLVQRSEKAAAAGRPLVDRLGAHAGSQRLR